MRKKMISALLAAAMMGALVLGGCGSEGQTPDSQEPAEKQEGSKTPEEDKQKPAGDENGGASYTFGFNTWGSGSYPLEVQSNAANTVMSQINCSIDTINNEFTADKIIQDLQSQISKGVDGIAMFNVAPALFGNISSICQEAEKPFVLYDKMPLEEDVLNQIKQNPYFLGVVACQDYDAGVQIGELALEDGCKKAIIVRAAAGDTAHDERERGFREVFEAGGGEIIGITNCADPSEAVTKSNDLITANPDADCLYGLGSDFAQGAINAIETRSDGASENLKIYTTDITPDMAQLLIDGRLAAFNGGQSEEGAIACCLLINYLDGHQILDENGEVPILNTMQMVNLTKEQAQGYIDVIQGGDSPISIDIYKSLLYRYNPDVTYQTYVDLFNRYAQEYTSKFQ